MNNDFQFLQKVCGVATVPCCLFIVGFMYLWKMAIYRTKKAPHVFAFPLAIMDMHLTLQERL